MRDLILECLETRPSARPSALQIVQRLQQLAEPFLAVCLRISPQHKQEVMVKNINIRLMTRLISLLATQKDHLTRFLTSRSFIPQGLPK